MSVHGKKQNSKFSKDGDIYELFEQHRKMRFYIPIAPNKMLHQQADSDILPHMPRAYWNFTKNQMRANYLLMELISAFHHRSLLFCAFLHGKVQGQGTYMHQMLFEKRVKKRRMLLVHMNKYENCFLTQIYPHLQFSIISIIQVNLNTFSISISLLNKIFWFKSIYLIHS